MSAKQVPAFEFQRRMLSAQNLGRAQEREASVWSFIPWQSIAVNKKMSALRFADEHTSRIELIAGLVSGMIAAHSVHHSLHRVLLEDFSRRRISKSVHQRFENGYTSLYTKLISASECSGANPRSEVRAHVLSAAIEGVVHDAAPSGTLRSPAL